MRNKILVFCIVLISIIALLIPTSVSASEPAGASGFVATPDQLKKIQELFGKPIAFGDFLQMIFPGELDKIIKEIPESMSQKLLESPMTWPDLPDPSKVKQKTSQPGIVNTSSILLENSATDQSIWSILYYQESNPQVGSGNIYHYGSIWTSPALSMPYLSTFSWLYYLDGSNWTIAQFAYNSVSNQSVCAAGDNFYTQVDGYYYTQGSYHFISPAGWEPAEGWPTLTNSPVYCTP